MLRSVHRVESLASRKHAKMNANITAVSILILLAHSDANERDIVPLYFRQRDDSAAVHPGL